MTVKDLFINILVNNKNSAITCSINEKSDVENIASLYIESFRDCSINEYLRALNNYLLANQNATLKQTLNHFKTVDCWDIMD